MVSAKTLFYTLISHVLTKYTGLEPDENTSLTTRDKKSDGYSQMEELKRIRDQNCSNTLEHENSSKREQSAWSSTITGMASSNLIINKALNYNYTGPADAKRLNISQPRGGKRKISPPNFKPDIVKVRYALLKSTLHCIHSNFCSEQRKNKRLSNVPTLNNSENIRTSMKSNMTTRIKNYEHKLFNNLKVEEEKQQKKIEQLQKSHADSIKNK